ncbi:uncharacterized protein LOC119679404 [Teleopsis dalmanni]|uniref:uncharacterized protein LOC119679404 n=1 Tax=Teleopsis dalmanni TaxID=139649 RepID=UPI0018CF46C6|nr:uncharacterized protein LOC119679404 [Teleopsis dalmanni]
MYRSKLLTLNSGITFFFNRNYLSNNFKDVISKNIKKASFSVTENLNLKPNSDLTAINLDSIVKSLNPNEEQHIDLQSLLLKFRMGKEATKMFESNQYIIIDYFLESDNVKELLLILKNKRHFGIFLDEITGSYILDRLLKKSDYISATQIAVEIMLQDEINSNFLNLLSIQSCFNYLKQYSPEEITQEKEENDVTEKKVRVKFLQCYEPHKVDYTPGYSKELIIKTMQKLSRKVSSEIALNVNVLATVFNNDFEEAIRLIKSGSTKLHKDVLNVCLTLSKNDDLNTNINEVLPMINDATFQEKLNLLINEEVKETEQQLTQQLNQKNDLWATAYQNRLSEEERLRKQLDCINNSKQTLEKIEDEKQKLWFFDLEEKIDLEIHQKKVTYPKRWFGKKKKPRSIDDSYIPPEIIKKSNAH